MAIDWENYGRERYGRTNPQSYEYRETSYIDGNTVRKASAVPERRERVERRPERRHVPKRQPVALPGISAKSFVFLTAMLGMVVFTCFSYLSAQTEVRNMKDRIVTMQSEIATQHEENEEMYQEIVNSVDLSEIYEKATKKLKMKQADNNQIYTYSNKKSNMVKQYADIPGAEE